MAFSGSSSTASRSIGSASGVPSNIELGGRLMQAKAVVQLLHPPDGSHEAGDAEALEIADRRPVDGRRLASPRLAHA